MAATASSRALSVTSRLGAPATERATGQYTAGAVASQNFAIAVCSGVRCVLFFPPSALISLKSRVHVWLVKAGGGPGRNWSGRSMTHGVRFPQCGTAGITVGTYEPGVVCGRYVSGATLPSLAHDASTAVAACSPTVMPLVFACPSGTAVSTAW